MLTKNDPRVVMQAYAHSHDPQYFAEDAVFVIRALHESFNGRQAIGAMLRAFYTESFSEAGAELHHIAVDADGNLGFVEFTFRGRHIGNLFGVPATGRTVEVPMLAIYELDGALIQRARLYFDSAEFFRQLGR
jgi:steroid delta-isomerase-like uncharacterized protein